MTPPHGLLAPGREAARMLRAIVEQELTAPATTPELHRQLRAALPALTPVLELLASKDEERRATFLVRSESAWYRRFGFRLMRPLLLLGLLGAVAFSLQRFIDPTLGVACFLAGAFAFYLLLQLFVHRWSRQDVRALDRFRAAHRQRLEGLLAKLDAEQAEVADD